MPEEISSFDNFDFKDSNAAIMLAFIALTKLLAEKGILIEDEMANVLGSLSCDLANNGPEKVFDAIPYLDEIAELMDEDLSHISQHL